MKAINLSAKNLDDFSVVVTLNRLQENEFCYLRLDSINNIDEKTKAFLSRAAAKTSKLAVSIPLEDLTIISISEIFELTKAQTISFRTIIDNDTYAKNYHLGLDESGDRSVINKIKNCFNQMPVGKELAIEFDYQDDFRLLGSTITNLHKLGINWMVLNPSVNYSDRKMRQYRELFDFLRMMRLFKLNIYFDFCLASRGSWQLKTLNTFSGLKSVHIDLSNKCTHSCKFCGLYGEDAIALSLKSSKEQAAKVREFMSQEIDGDKALEIIQSLPFDTATIVFGGAGDPLMHPRAKELLIAARKRGFCVEILSNLEYLNDTDIAQISAYGSAFTKGIRFIVNVAAGAAETYIKIRPKQSAKTFEKVTRNIVQFASHNKQHPEKEVLLTLLFVVNSLNYNKVVEFANYTLETGAQSVMLKPVELHAEFMRPILLKDEEKVILKSELKEALKIFDANNIYVMDRDYCEEIIKQ